MKTHKSIFILIFVLALCFIPIKNSYSGDIDDSNRIFYLFTDTTTSNVPWSVLYYFFDLRERETFIQLTYPAFSPLFENTGSPAIAHVQIYDVSNNCNENDFFDAYTVSDTHVYNMRDIKTNDGNPSGVVLPDGAYGIVTIYVESEFSFPRQRPFGNMRIIDNNGYEYRTNAPTSGVINGRSHIPLGDFFPNDPFLTFNFNKEAGVTFSDVVGITTLLFDNQNLAFPRFTDSSDVANIFYPLDIDIFDNSENVFSCRNVIFSCVDEDNPRLEELLENAESASVASFEYGINNAIPHSKNGELLCPGNTIDEGIVKLTPLMIPLDVINRNENKQFQIGPGAPFFIGFIGLNSGNSRGSFDAFWVISQFFGVEE